MNLLKSVNRIVSFLLTVILLVGVMPFSVTALAEEGDTLSYEGNGTVYYSYREGIIPDGVFAEGIEISGLSKREAIEAVKREVNRMDLIHLTVLDEEGNVYELSVADLHMEWANPEIIKEAALLTNGANPLERYKKRVDLSRNPVVYPIEVVCDEKALSDQLTEVSESIASEASNATLTREGGEFVITPGQAGYGMDVAATLEAVKTALYESTDYADIEIAMMMGLVEPTWGESDLAMVQDLLGTFTTSYKSSGSSRCNNISNACSKVNGTILYPGEEFSTLATITPFTIANGYKEAGSYAGGKVVQSVGGGICQVSSTLYNAVLLAELEVTDRSNHAMMVDYVKVGMDATVSNDSGVDFKFVNSTDYPIYIEGYTEGKTITLNIYGKETRPQGREVSYVTDITEKITPGPEACYADPSNGVGYVEVQPAHTGYVADVYKVVTEDGVEVSREWVNHSKYKMTSKYALVGTNTSDPTTLAVLAAAIATNNIAYVKGVVGQLVAGTYVIN